MPSWICRLPFLKSSHHLHKFPIFPHISHFTFSTSTPKISIFDYLVNQHDFSPECASKVSSLSSANYIRKPQNADSVLNFLKETGFSKNQIETLVQKEPNVLSSNIETTIKPKIRVFQDLGFQSTDMADIISVSPWLLLHNCPDRIRRPILALKNVFGPNVDICRLLKKSGFVWSLKYDFEWTFVPNIEYLKSCGICSLRIASYVCSNPLIFLANQEKLKGIVQRVDGMGFERESNMFLEAVRTISSLSVETWEMKLKLFRDLGFSEQNISYAFRVYPRVFTVSERKIVEVTELLLSVEDFSVSDIVRLPVVLSHSEKRLKLRVGVLKALQGKNLLEKTPTFSTFFQMTDANFTKKYLIPYSDELGDLYVASKGSQPTDSDEKF